MPLLFFYEIIAADKKTNSVSNIIELLNKIEGSFNFNYALKKELLSILERKKNKETLYDKFYECLKITKNTAVLTEKYEALSKQHDDLKSQSELEKKNFDKLKQKYEKELWMITEHFYGKGAEPKESTVLAALRLLHYAIEHNSSSLKEYVNSGKPESSELKVLDFVGLEGAYKIALNTKREDFCCSGKNTCFALDTLQLMFYKEYYFQTR